MKRTDSDVREIERNIDETRVSLQHTLEALERKLSPDMLLHRTVDRFRATGGEFAGNLTHTVRDNPLPTLLTSIGLAWLMLGSRHNGQARDAGDGYETRPGDGRMHRAADSAREAAERARDAASTTAHRMRGAASTATDRVRGAAQAARERAHGMAASAMHARDEARDRARGMADSARHVAQSAREGFAQAHERADRMAQEQPLVLGAIGLAAGALIGAIMPPAEALGERMHSGMDRARDKAGRMREHLQEKADELRAAGESSSTTDGQHASSGFDTSRSSEEQRGDSSTDRDRYSPTTH